MEYWSVLGIDSTEDVSTIKKAYAKKLRIYHPEDDPKNYQILRESYDRAIKYANDNKKIKDKQEYNSKDFIDLTFEKEVKLENETGYKNNTYLDTKLDDLQNQNKKILDINDKNDDFMLQVENLYNNFFERIKIENWKKLLNNDVIWDIDNKKVISRLMINFFSSHHYLPQNIWIFLESNFNWCSEENYDDYYYDDEFIIYIQKQIEKDKPLSYSFFKKLKSVDYEKFLDYREKAQDNFENHNIEDASFYIKQGKEIYEDDPDLLCIEGKILLQSDNIDLATEILNKALSINLKDLNMISYRAVCHYEKKQFNEFIKDYNYIYNKNTDDDNEINFFIAKTYFEIGNLEKSKEWILKVIEKDSFNNEPKLLLAHIYTKLRSKFTKELERNPSDNEIEVKLNSINCEVYRVNKQKTFKEKAKLILITLLKIIFYLGIIFKVLLRIYR